MFLGSLPAPTYGAVEYMEKEIMTNCFPIQTNCFPIQTNRFLKFLIFFFTCVAGQDIYVNLNVLKTSLKYFSQNQKMYINTKVNTGAFLEKEDLRG